MNKLYVYTGQPTWVYAQNWDRGGNWEIEELQTFDVLSNGISGIDWEWKNKNWTINMQYYPEILGRLTEIDPDEEMLYAGSRS